MAWFRRKHDDESGDEAPAEAPPAAPERSAGDVVRAERSRPGDWMALPPIHTTVGPPPSTFRVQRVSEIMTTRRPTAFLGQLGHQVSSSAPSGHVEGLTTTVSRPAAAARPTELPLHGRVPHHEDTTGDSTAAAPVVSRELLPSSPAPAPFPTVARLPDPSPSRVLREPSRPPSPLEARVPSLPVVDAGTPSSASSSSTSSSWTSFDTARAGDVVVPDAPVEFTVQPPTPEAPLAGSTPVRRAPSPAATPPTAGQSARTGPGSLDLPLAGSGAVRGAEMMPPIQPRAVQRRAQEATASPPPPPSTSRAEETSRPGGDDLAPLPTWAREAIGREDADVTIQPPAAPDVAMPLAPSRPSAGAAASLGAAGDVQVGAEPEAATAEAVSDAPIQREAADAGGGATAPLAGGVPPMRATAMPTSGTAFPDEHGPGGATTPSGDLVLHGASAPASTAADTVSTPLVRGADPAAAGEARPVTAPADAGPPVQRDAEPAIRRDGEATAARDGEATGHGDGGATAPLLGDRPLQRLPETTSPAVAAVTPAKTLALPLVADTANGPALDLPSTASLAPTAAASGMYLTRQSSPPANGLGPAGATSPAAAATSAPTASGSLRPLASLQRSPATRAAPAPDAAPSPTGSAAERPLRTLLAAPVQAATTPEASEAAAPALAAPVRSAPHGDFAIDGPTPAARTTSGTNALAATALAQGTPAVALAVQTQRDGAAMPLQAPVRPPAAAGDATTVLRQALENGTGFFDGDGNVVLTNPAPGLDPAASGGAAAVQREAAPAVTSFVVQREDAPAAAAPPGTAGPAAPSGSNDAQLDEMAQKVYDRIRWKLASELRADQRRLGAGHWNRKGR